MGEETKIGFADAYASAQRAEEGASRQNGRPGAGFAGALFQRALIAGAILAGGMPGIVLHRLPDRMAADRTALALAAVAGLLSGTCAWALCALRCVWRPGGAFMLWLVCTAATVGGAWITRMQLLAGPPLTIADFAYEVIALALASACVVRFGAIRPRFFCSACGRRGRGRFRLKDLCLLVPESRAYVALAAGDVSSLLSSTPVATPGRAVVTVDVRFCDVCCRGSLWVSRIGASGRPVREPLLQGIELAPEAVRALLELAQDDAARRARR